VISYLQIACLVGQLQHKNLKYPCY